MMPAAVAGEVLALTPVGGFLLSTLIFGGAVTGDVVLSIVLIVAGIVLTLRSVRRQFDIGAAAHAVTGEI
jgi:drug/metabolite transporter (DMT)-like permease